MNFDKNGHIRASRNPEDPAPLAWAHGLSMVYVVKGSALVLSDDTNTETTITLRPYTEGARGSSMIFGTSSVFAHGHQN